MNADLALSRGASRSSFSERVSSIVCQGVAIHSSDYKHFRTGSRQKDERKNREYRLSSFRAKHILVSISAHVLDGVRTTLVREEMLVMTFQVATLGEKGKAIDSIFHRGEIQSIAVVDSVLMKLSNLRHLEIFEHSDSQDCGLFRPILSRPRHQFKLMSRSRQPLRDYPWTRSH